MAIYGQHLPTPDQLRERYGDDWHHRIGALGAAKVHAMRKAGVGDMKPIPPLPVHTHAEYVAMGKKSGETQREAAKANPSYFSDRQRKGWETRRKNGLDDMHDAAAKARQTLRDRLGPDGLKTYYAALSRKGNEARWKKGDSNE